MSMERHRCKLCSKIFSNGRALGGHMRSHLASLPLPPKKKTQHQHQLGDRTQSDSSSTHLENEFEGTKDENFIGYVLRENPKKSTKASDPEFLDDGSVVQDRESETESTQNPTRKRSKRASQKPFESTTLEIESKKMKSESVTESTPVSSVSDPGQDEEVALCLMMLSRDVWDNSFEDTNDSSELKTRLATRGSRFKCVTCKKVFKTNRALTGHRASSKECQQVVNNNTCKKNGENEKIYECPFCYKVFGSGQALGGHKRSHLLGSSNSNNIHVVGSNNNNNNNNNNVNGGGGGGASIVDKVGDTTSFVLDLNLPAPVDDDEDHSHLDFH